MKIFSEQTEHLEQLGNFPFLLFRAATQLSFTVLGCQNQESHRQPSSPGLYLVVNANTQIRNKTSLCSLLTISYNLSLLSRVLIAQRVVLADIRDLWEIRVFLVSLFKRKSTVRISVPTVWRQKEGDLRINLTRKSHSTIRNDMQDSTCANVISFKEKQRSIKPNLETISLLSN